MKNIIKILISALLILCMAVLPVAAVENESDDTAWMEKLSSFPEGEYEKMTDGDLRILDIWLVDSKYIPAEIGVVDYYESNMSFFEKYVPEERRESNFFVSRYTPYISVKGTAAEAEYYCRLDEVKSVIVCTEIKAINCVPEIVRPEVTVPMPAVWRVGISKTVAELKAEMGKELDWKDPNGNILPDNAFVGTGCFVVDGNQRYNMSIYGDINGDGAFSAIDYLSLTASIVSREGLKPAYRTAADVNNDGVVSAADCLAMKTLLRK